MTGKRFNQGKTRYDLVPTKGIEMAAKVFEFGSKKYGNYNWCEGLSYSGVIASMERHLVSLKRKEDIDEESGFHQIGHIICNALMIAEFIDGKLEGDDDRYSWSKKEPEAIQEIEELGEKEYNEMFVFLKNCKRTGKTPPFTVIGEKIKQFPKVYHTYELCNAFFEVTGLILDFFPVDVKMRMNSGRTWRYIPFFETPEKHKTAELCKIAVEKEGDNLEFVPKELITYELCELSLNNNGSFEHVPRDLIDMKLCHLYIENNGILRLIPKEFITYEFAYSAIKAGNSIEHVPYNLIDEELCLLHINNGLQLDEIPFEFRTFEVCKQAINKYI